MTRIIAVSTNKGGVLKTSVTVNLAGVISRQIATDLASAGNKVLIIDTDNQGNATMSFGLNPDNIEYTLYDVLVDGLPIERTVINVYKNIDLIPANDDLAFFEFDVLTKGKVYKKPFSLLKNAIQYIENDYDFILVDSPPNLGLSQGNILAYVDEVLIPFQPEPYAMRSLVKMLKSIKSFRELHNPSLEVLGVVSTLVDRRTSLHGSNIQKAKAYCEENGIRMFQTEIPRIIRYANSIDKQKLPATLVGKKKAEDVEPYYDLLEEIVHGKTRQR